ncbi:alpha/beta hydrolase [Nocardioides sp. YIM B13467]|uniref:alpha/beta hydrolase n=1 Tax=Nocardioides sp. YIM B13467 TaxID=3366294 RepID=UPI003672174E
MEGREITFNSVGSTCAGIHLRGEHSASEPRPCVVMAHGFSGTVGGGILGFGEGPAAAGFDVLLFDYRGFGRSAGTPRQLVSYRRQRADYRSAIHAAFRRLHLGMTHLREHCAEPVVGGRSGPE